MINLSGLRFYYPEKPNQCVLQIPKWSVEAGERVFLHGPSGSGKSTLLNILGGLLPVQEGEVSILHQRIDCLSARKRDQFRAKHIGYVFQQFNLIPYLNALDNICLASQFSKKCDLNNARENAKELLRNLSIKPTYWLMPTSKLSMGQQQRVAIARALINKPELLIADEPTSSLDRSNRDAYMELLKSIVADVGSTLLFVSHDMDLASHFERVEALEELNQAEAVDVF